mgnify:CR=1 FL=1
MRIKYCGKKALPYRLPTPIPFLFKSERNGELVFEPECDVTNEDWARFLTTQCGETFVQVEEKVNKFAPISEEERALRHAGKVEATTGKKFRGKPGKWQAMAFLKKHGLTNDLGLKKLQIGTKVIHWECVPFTLADVKVGQAECSEPPISEESEGLQEEVYEHESDSLSV